MNLSTYWMLAGITLLVGEMLTGGSFLIFIALGCFAAALGALTGFAPLAQMGTCAGVTVAGTVGLRQIAMRRMTKSAAPTNDVGKEITVDQALPPHGSGRIRYQGTSWEATNLGAEEIAASDRAVIVGMDGNTLLLRKVN